MLDDCIADLIHAYLPPREAALQGVALCITVAVLLAVFSLFDADDFDDLHHWAQREWMLDNCTVVKAGIEYVGDCRGKAWFSMRPQHAPPSFNYSECTVDTSEGCAGLPDFVVDMGRRLGSRSMPDFLCRDSFLPWAVVMVRGGYTCSYRSGLARGSKILVWDDARHYDRQLAAGSERQCWLLRMSRPEAAEPESSSDRSARLPCDVVALEDPNTWPDVKRSWVQKQRWIRTLLLFAALGSTVSACAIALLHLWLSRVEVQGWDQLNQRETTLAPMPEDESERVHGVRDRWNVFRAGMLAEYQLVNSARNVDLD